MDAEMRALRRKFKGQKVSLKGGSFDNSPFELGTYTCMITDSRAKKLKRSGGERLCHQIITKVVEGDAKGRFMFPFSPPIDDVEGLASVASNVRRIKGDVVPGYEGEDGDWQLSVDAFFDEIESFMHSLIGEVVEIRVVDCKPRKDGKHLRDDGTPWQNFYIQRGLGDDKAGVEKGKSKGKKETRKPADSLKVGGKKKAPPRKVPKKKVTRKRGMIKT